MYPFVRFAKERLRHRRAPALGLFEEHVTTLICWPWDLDPWGEMNNGRILTLYDLGRIPFGERIGLDAAIRREGWGIAVAGTSIRYRRRLTVFRRFRLRSRLLGWDGRFFYIGQDMWAGDEALSGALLRIAVLEDRRAIPPPRVLAAMGHDGPPPPLPGWVAAWVAAEAMRPWPPVSHPAG